MAPVSSRLMHQSIGKRGRMKSKFFGYPAPDISAASVVGVGQRFLMFRWTAQCSRFPLAALMVPSRFGRRHIFVAPAVQTGMSIWMRLP